MVSGLKLDIPKDQQMKTVNSVHTYMSKYVHTIKNVQISNTQILKTYQEQKKLKKNPEKLTYEQVFFCDVLVSFYFCSHDSTFNCNEKNNSNLHAKNMTCRKSNEAKMVSTIDINSNSNMSAQEKLEEIQHPVENLQLTLSTLTKMSLDVSLTAEELTALLTTLHKQVVDIQRFIEA